MQDKVHSDRSTIARAWLLAWLGSLGLYAVTAGRGTQWVDSGYYILRITRGQLDSDLGLALTHPLHYWLGRLAIWIGPMEPATAITMVSAVAGAFAVANVLACVLELTGNKAAAWFAAGSLAVANVYWHMATITEVYTLSAALLSAELLLLIRFVRSARTTDLLAMLLFNGLGIANHLQATLTTPILLAVVMIEVYRARVRPKHLPIALAVWLAGTLPYSVLVAQELIRSGDVPGTLRSALFGLSESGASYAHNVLNLLPVPRVLGNGLLWILFSFPNLLLPMAVVGVWYCCSRHQCQAANLLENQTAATAGGRYIHARELGLALLGALLIHATFVLRYNVVDQHTFLLPTLVLLSIFGGWGMASLSSNRLAVRFIRACPAERARMNLAAKRGENSQEIVQGCHRTAIVILAFLSLALTPVVYAVTPAAARHFDVLGSRERHKPYRDDYRYLFWPWAVADHSAARMSQQALDLAGPDGLILVEDPMGLAAVQYQADQRAWDTQIILANQPSPQILAQLDEAERAESPIVLVPRDTRTIADPWNQRGPWVRVGDLYVRPDNGRPQG